MDKEIIIQKLDDIISRIHWNIATEYWEFNDETYDKILELINNLEKEKC